MMIRSLGSYPKTACGSNQSVLPIDTHILFTEPDISLTKDAVFPSGLNQMLLRDDTAENMLDHQLSQMRLWDGIKREARLWEYFNVSPNLFAPDGNCIVYLEGPDVSDQKPVIKINFDLLVKAKCSPLILQAVVMPSIRKQQRRRLRASQAQFRRRQNTRPACSLFLAAPAALNVSEVVRYHITTRNFFAWIANEPLVGPDPVSALLALKVRMDTWCSISVDKLAALNKYALTHGYGDIGSLHTLVTHHLQGIKNLSEDYKLTTDIPTSRSAQASISTHLECLSTGQVSHVIRKRLSSLSNGVKAFQKGRPRSESKELPTAPSLADEAERSGNTLAMSGALKDSALNKSKSRKPPLPAPTNKSDAYQRLVTKYIMEDVHRGLNAEAVQGCAPLTGERDLWIKSSSRDYFQSLIQHATSSKSLPAVIPAPGAHRPNSLCIPPRGRQSYQSVSTPTSLRPPSPILEEVSSSHMVSESGRTSLPTQTKYVCAKHRQIQADKSLIELLQKAGEHDRGLHELTAASSRPSTGVRRHSTGITRPGTGVSRPRTTIAGSSSTTSPDMSPTQLSRGRARRQDPESDTGDSVMRFPSLHNKKSTSLGQEGESNPAMPPLPPLPKLDAYPQGIVALLSPGKMVAVEVEGVRYGPQGSQKVITRPIKLVDSLQPSRIPSRSSSGCRSSTYGTSYTEPGELRSATSYTSSSSFAEMPNHSSIDKSKAQLRKLSPIPSSASLSPSKSYRVPLDDFEPGIGDVKVMDILLEGMGGIRRTGRCETLSAYRKYDLYDFTIPHKSVYLGPTPTIARYPSKSRSEDFSNRSRSMTNIFKPKTASRTSLRDAINLQASFQTIETYLKQTADVSTLEDTSRPTTPVCELAA